MESSFAGAPPETESQTPEAPVTPEQVAAEMNEAEARQTAPAEGTEGGSVQATLDEMRQKLDAVLEDRQEPSQAPNLLAALHEEDEFAQEPAQAGQPQAAEQTYEDPAAQEQINQLRAFIREEAEQLVSPLQEERRDEQLASIEQKYPDIVSESVMSRMKPLITSLVQRSGNEAMVDDPAVVMLAYKAVKAELADADAVPAESAAQGASLETNSGVGNAQAGEPSIEEQYKSLVYPGARKSEL